MCYTIFECKKMENPQHHFRYGPVNRSVTGRLSGLVKSLL